MYSNMFIETGYNKWGMTSSNVAANIVKDKILGNDNKYSFVFDSLRMNPIKNKQEIKNMFNQVVRSFVINKIKIPKKQVVNIENDNGAIIKVDGNLVGIYKDKN